MRDNDNGGTTINAITIYVTDYGAVTIVDDADDVINGDLDDEHIDALVKLIFERAGDTSIGTNLDVELNDHYYYHVGDDSVHEDCYNASSVKYAINSAISKLSEYA